MTSALSCWTLPGLAKTISLFSCNDRTEFRGKPYSALFLRAPGSSRLAVESSLAPEESSPTVDSARCRSAPGVHGTYATRLPGRVQPAAPRNTGLESMCGPGAATRGATTDISSRPCTTSRCTTSLGVPSRPSSAAGTVSESASGGAGTSGVHPHRVTPDTGRAQRVQTTDPCNKVTANRCPFFHPPIIWSASRVATDNAPASATHLSCQHFSLPCIKCTFVP